MKTDFKVYKRKIHVYQLREGAPRLLVVYQCLQNVP